MNLLDATLNTTNNPSGEKSLNNVKAIRVSPEVFNRFYSHRHQSFGITNSGLVNEVAQRWDDLSKGIANIEISEIHVDASKIKRIDPATKRIYPVRKEELEQLDIEEVAVSRAIAKICAKGLDDSFAPAIAVNINENGYEFGWGNQVFVCSNFNILSAAHRWNDYHSFKSEAGGNYTKLEANNIRMILSQYMEESSKFFDDQLERILQLQKIEVGKTEFAAFMGNMFTKIEYANNARVNRRIATLTNEQKFLPVNSRQLAAIAVESVSPAHAHVFGWKNDQANLWQITNWGTETLKAEHGCDMATLLQTTANWSEAVVNYFQAN